MVSYLVKGEVYFSNHKHADAGLFSGNPYEDV